MTMKHVARDATNESRVKMASVLLLLLVWLQLTSTQNSCVMGNFDQYSQWIGQNGIIKFPTNQWERDYKDNLAMHYYDPEEFMEDYLMIHSCPDFISEAVDSNSGCSHCAATKMFSCYGMDIKQVRLPNNLQRTTLAIFRMNFVNLTTLTERTFDDLDTRHLKIQFGGISYIRQNAFLGTVNLNTLSVTRNDIKNLGKVAGLLSGLKNLTHLYLDQNNIKTWNTDGIFENSEPILPKLEFLSFSGNPFDSLNSSSFDWLRGSQLRFLNLRESRLHVRQHGVLSSVRESLEFLDLGGSLMGVTSLTNIMASLNYPNPGKNKLQGLGLSNLRLYEIPTIAILHVAATLKYLSLHGNYFDILGGYISSGTKHAKTSSERITYIPPLPRLEELDLQDCQLKSIKLGAFDTVPNLKILNLAQNALSSFEEHSFRGLGSLKHLSLRLNREEPFSPPLFGYIFEPLSLHFEDLRNLETLDFSEANIGHLRADAFKGLGKTLKNLSLCKVGTETMEYGVFSNLSGLEFLDVSGNVKLVTKSSADLFIGLSNLSSLHMSDCNIDFQRPIYTGISTLNSDLFRHLPNLKLLNLTDNNIKFLTDGAFKSLKNVETIDLGYNRVLSWTVPVFKANKRLKQLFLNRNRISFMTPAMLKEFNKLEILDISENPFLCDAYIGIFLNMASNVDNSTGGDEDYENRSLLPKLHEISPNLTASGRYDLLETIIFGDVVAGDVAEFLRENLNFDRAVTDLIDARQVEMFKLLWYSNMSDLRNNSLFVVGLDTSPHIYTCLCSINSTYLFFTDTNASTCEAPLDASSSDNLDVFDIVDITITVAITVIASLAVGLVSFSIYRQRLRIRYFAVQIKNATIMSFMGRSDEDENEEIYVYDTFISYSDENREYVLDQLMPNLEIDNECKVCLHERDFQVGLSILENIIASMDHSRCILLVVSMSFVKSQWCQFELHLAQHRMLETRRENLVLVFLEEIPKAKRPKLLQFLMLTKTYLQWPGDKADVGEKQLFWKRLRKAVNPLGGCSVSTA